MNKRNHLKRLPPEYYQGDTIVHWTLTTLDRKQGWLSVPFYYRFRELLTHRTFRYGLACPIFCLMPDHLHMIWLGLCKGADQLHAMKHFRKSINESLRRIGHELQDQSYDHVLKEEERREVAFRETCNYVARNPERAGLVEVDGYASYKFSGCIVPGYPELRPFELGFWDRFDRVISYLRKEGLVRTA
jgi:REP element-mobilizing transposase RayT